MMYLSSHFTLDEMTHSQAAARAGIDNTPIPAIVDNLKRLAYGLEEVRTLLNGEAIMISSGYRSPEVNKLVGGKPNSQHQTGNAADFTCPAYGPTQKIIAAIIASTINYDQVILEFASSSTGGWVHISFTDTPRRMALVIDLAGTRAYA